MRRMTMAVISSPANLARLERLRAISVAMSRGEGVAPQDVAALCDDRLPGLTDTTQVKGLVYRRHFLLEPRPKFHGFETVMRLDDALRPELVRRLGAHDAIARTSYADLVARLAP